jgi:hypothetical protein
MIRCPICGVQIRDEDLVGLDFINTIYHYSCLAHQHIYIIEIGFFKLIKKYFWIDHSNSN